MKQKSPETFLFFERKSIYLSYRKATGSKGKQSAGTDHENIHESNAKIKLTYVMGLKGVFIRPHIL